MTFELVSSGDSVNHVPEDTLTYVDAAAYERLGISTTSSRGKINDCGQLTLSQKADVAVVHFHHGIMVRGSMNLNPSLPAGNPPASIFRRCEYGVHDLLRVRHPDHQSAFDAESVEHPVGEFKRHLQRYVSVIPVSMQPLFAELQASDDELKYGAFRYATRCIPDDYDLISYSFLLRVLARRAQQDVVAMQMHAEMLNTLQKNACTLLETYSSGAKDVSQSKTLSRFVVGDTIAVLEHNKYLGPAAYIRSLTKEHLSWIGRMRLRESIESAHVNLQHGMARYPACFREYFGGDGSIPRGYA